MMRPAQMPKADPAISATSCRRVVARRIGSALPAKSRTAGSAARFIVTYNAATNKTESKIARGIVRSGWRTSLPRKVML